MKFKVRYLVILATLVILSTMTYTIVNAQEAEPNSGNGGNSGAIWTTDGSCGAEAQDLNHYQIGHTVYINGSGFSQGLHYWTIKGQPGQASADPGIIVASGWIFVDHTGNFCINAYTVNNDDAGEYKVNVDNKGDNYRVDLGTPSVGVNVSGSCAWTPQSGSSRYVSLTIEGASVTITKAGGGSYGPYSSSTNLYLSAGSYSYSYTATSGFEGSGSGQFTVTECPVATATVNPLTCEWDAQNQTSSMGAQLTIANAVVTISDTNGVVGTYSSSQTVSLPEGSYTYSWVAAEGYQGSGSGSFALVNCEPGKGDVSVDIGECTYDANDGSLINVALTVQNATLSIDGNDYTTSQTIKLAPGTYSYNWSATEGNEGSGSGSITVYGCEPATVSVNLGECSWDGQVSTTSGNLTVTGATLVIMMGDTEFGTYGPGTYNVDFPVGSFTYTWTANENFTGSGSGSFSTVSCEPGKADASVDLGSCTGDNGQSYSDISITISNAILTIDGKEYTESAVLKLEPGDYAYSWQAIDNEFTGSGEGVLTVTNCAPKVSVDPSFDVAAGGSGPSVINSVAPLLAGVAGLGLASIFVFKGKKEN